MTDTPTHSEVIAACDVLTRVSYTPRVTKEQLQSVKAQAQNGLATERQDEEDCSLGRAVMDAYPDYLNGDYTMLGRAVRAAIEAMGARIVPADGQQNSTDAAPITWHLGPVQVRSAEAASDGAAEDSGQEDAAELTRGRWDRTVLAGEPIPDDLVTKFRRAVEQSADDPANVLYKTHVYNGELALRAAIERRGELIGYRTVQRVPTAPDRWQVPILGRFIPPEPPVPQDGESVAALYLLPKAVSDGE